MRGRLWRKSAVKGTFTGSAFVTRAYPSTASKVGSATTTFLPGPRKAMSAICNTSPEPQPSTTRSAATPCSRAMASVRRASAASG